MQKTSRNVCGRQARTLFRVSGQGSTWEHRGLHPPREFSAFGFRTTRTHRSFFGLLAPPVRAEAVGANHFGAHAVDLGGNGAGSNVFIYVDHQRCLRAIIGAPADADAENRRIRHQTIRMLSLAVVARATSASD